MNRRGKPEYCRGWQWCALVCDMLALIRRSDAGEKLDGEDAALVQELGAALTPRMRRYLELYYVEGANQPDIARLTGSHRSNVCRVLQRGENNLERVLKKHQKGAR